MTPLQRCPRTHCGGSLLGGQCHLCARPLHHVTAMVATVDYSSLFANERAPHGRCAWCDEPLPRPSGAGGPTRRYCPAPARCRASASEARTREARTGDGPSDFSSRGGQLTAGVPSFSLPGGSFSREVHR